MVVGVHDAPHSQAVSPVRLMESGRVVELGHAPDDDAAIAEDGD
jgi:hypothetical protein